MRLPTVPSLDWLNRDIRWIMVGRFVRSMSQGYQTIIVTLFLLQIGFTAVSLGTLFAISAVVNGVLIIAVSLLADRYGRKPFLIAFPLLTAMGAIVFVLSRNFWLIVAASSLGSIGRGGGGAGGAGAGGPIYPAQQALIADHSPAERRNDIFAALSTTDTLAMAIGSLIAGIPDLLTAHFGYSRADSYHPLFLLMAVLSIVMALSVLPIRETVHRKQEKGPKRSLLPRESRKVIGRFALSNFVNGMGVGFFAPFVTYWFYERFGTTSATLGFLFAAVSLGATVPYVLSPIVARRVGTVNTVVGIRLVGVATLSLLPFMPTFGLAAAVYFTRMVLQRASIPLRQSYSMGVVAKEERSSAAGLSNLPSQVSAAVSPQIAGYLFESVSLEIPFEIGASLQLLNALLYFGLFRNIKPPEEVVKVAANRDDKSAPAPKTRQTSDTPASVRKTPRQG